MGKERGRKMELKKFVESSELRPTDLARICSISRNALYRYMNGVDVPGLEVALLLCKCTDGKVLPQEFLVDEKRRRSEPGDPIVNFRIEKKELLDDLL